MTIDSIDVSGLQPVARSIVRRLAQVYVAHLGTDLISLVAHGSAVKGGIIPGGSDVDVVTFVDPASLTPGGELPLERALGLHRDLARIDPAPFRYLQGRINPSGEEFSVGFIPGTYHVVAGSPDVPLATGAELLDAAKTALAALEPAARCDKISHALLDHGEGRLDRQVRYLCTDVWPVMYHVACIHMGDGLAAWQRTKPEVVRLLGDDPVIGPPLTRWFETVHRHYATGEVVDSALATIQAGVGFIEGALDWARSRS